MGDFPVIKDMEEKKKEGFPLWDGVFCPEWFEQLRDIFPNPKERIYYSSNKFGPVFNNGFCRDKDTNWNKRGILIEFITAADESGWYVGECFGFRKSHQTGASY